MTTCPDCLGAGVDMAHEVCLLCHGHGLLVPVKGYCSQCEGAGRLRTIRCPQCRGHRIVTYYIGIERQPQVIEAQQLKTALRQIEQQRDFNDTYAVGVLCGLHAEAMERYPDDPDLRSSWMQPMLERGQVVVGLDGIWHLDGDDAARVVSFGDYE